METKLFQLKSRIGRIKEFLQESRIMEGHSGNLDSLPVDFNHARDMGISVPMPQSSFSKMENMFIPDSLNQIPSPIRKPLNGVTSIGQSSMENPFMSPEKPRNVGVPVKIRQSNAAQTEPQRDNRILLKSQFSQNNHD